LWVADVTYGSTWYYAAFVVDVYARRILGWVLATTMTSHWDGASSARIERGKTGNPYDGNR
jgi:transposase InsO family protein